MLPLAYLDPGDDGSVLESLLTIGIVFVVTVIVIGVFVWALRSIRRGIR